MQIHKHFIDQILLKRKAALRDFIVGKDSLDLQRLKPNIGALIDELDRIFYTIDFLKKEELINTREFHNNVVIDLFNGFEPPQTEDVYPIVFWMDKLKSHAYSLEIEMRPGLMAFKNNGYKTDEQLKDRKNFWLPIFVGLGSAAITAVLTALLTRCS